MSRAVHPMLLRLQGRRVLVVGGGAVATRRAIALVRDGGDVHVVSPDVRPALRALADQGLVTWSPRAYRPGDVDGAGDHRIVMAAAVAAANCTSPVIIRGAEAVNKSYPSFWDDFTELGGEFHVL